MHIIVDYGMGNLDSVSRACQRAGMDTKISGDSQDIRQAESIILPGVGAFGDAMQALEQSGLDAAIKAEVRQGKHILGICLGMQLLYEYGCEFGRRKGLGLLQGEIQKLSVPLKVPHMGWNSLELKRQDPVLKYICEGDFVYFVHSYYAVSDGAEVVASAQYGVEIPAVVRCCNVTGMQFHPEKSGPVGQRLLKACKEMISLGG